MRVMMLAGVILIGLSGFVLLNGGRLSMRREVLDAGPIHLSVNEPRRIAPWMTLAVLTGGVALVISGAMRKKA